MQPFTSIQWIQRVRYVLWLLKPDNIFISECSVFEPERSEFLDKLRNNPVLLGKVKDHMSRDMTKPTKWLCAQRRLRSAWASAQSDQSLRCPHEESLGPQLPIKRTAKTLIRLGGCPGWSESSLGAQTFCWFCDVAAHIQNPELLTQFVSDKPTGHSFDTSHELILRRYDGASLNNRGEP